MAVSSQRARKLRQTRRLVIFDTRYIGIFHSLRLGISCTTYARLKLSAVLGTSRRLSLLSIQEYEFSFSCQGCWLRVVLSLSRRILTTCRIHGTQGPQLFVAECFNIPNMWLRCWAYLFHTSGTSPYPVLPAGIGSPFRLTDYRTMKVHSLHVPNKIDPSSGLFCICRYPFSDEGSKILSVATTLTCHSLI